MLHLHTKIYVFIEIFTEIHLIVSWNSTLTERVSLCTRRRKTKAHTYTTSSSTVPMKCKCLLVLLLTTDENNFFINTFRFNWIQRIVPHANRIWETRRKKKSVWMNTFTHCIPMRARSENNVKRIFWCRFLYLMIFAQAN